MDTELVPCNAIILPSKWTLREPSPSDVDGLVESIKGAKGILQPIIVRRLIASGELKFELVAGRHRLEAARKMGWATIPASVIHCDDITAELSSIAENLHRVELEDEAWDTALARWSELYEAAHETPSKKGGRPKKTKTGRTPTSFSKHAAKKTGKSQTAIKQSLLRAKKLSPKARAAYRAKKVTKGQADELVKLPEAAQNKVLLLTAGKSVSETREVVKAERNRELDASPPPMDSKNALVAELQGLVDDCSAAEKVFAGAKAALQERAEALHKLAGEAELRTIKKARTFIEEVEKTIRLLAKREKERRTAFDELIDSMWASVEKNTWKTGGARSRPQRWGEACGMAIDGLEELNALREEYEAWGDNLPDNLRGGATEDKISDITAMDFDSALDAVQEAESADLPLGFGRD
jgi:ParB family chromosome partitioning protein